MTPTASKLAPNNCGIVRSAIAPHWHKQKFILKKPYCTHSNGKIEFHIQQRKTHHAAVDISSP
ncbi:hypothetical protein [Microcoleus sp. K5-D4]|uniref:hypothetical protein n=1 Tax=Microcoleus sp. K5-D4 TaxID=2818801 RepID=UPI002FD77A98